MVVGLPGTGIGGIFYILLAFMMPVREAFLSITGKGTSLLALRPALASSMTMQAL